MVTAVFHAGWVPSGSPGSSVQAAGWIEKAQKGGDRVI